MGVTTHCSTNSENSPHTAPVESATFEIFMTCHLNFPLHPSEIFNPKLLPTCLPTLLTFLSTRTHTMNNNRFAAVEIRLQDLQVQPGALLPEITSPKYLASYNWIDGYRPTMAVPGHPAVWRPPHMPQRVYRFTGSRSMNQNIVRSPSYPLEPLFRSVNLVDPEFSFRSVDFVADASDIRMLLNFVRGWGSQFSIKAEIAGETLLLSREEQETSTVGTGLGHEFEHANKVFKIDQSVDYWRIVTYNFGGLSVVARHEMDAYYDPEETMDPDETEQAALPTNTTPSGLNIIEQGKVVELDHGVEIKTKRNDSNIDFSHVAAQLWTTQTPNLVRAFYSGYVFHEVYEDNVADLVWQWETNNRRNMYQLVALIDKIAEVVRDQCAGAATIYHNPDAPGKLSVRNRERNRLLPDDLYSNWDS